MGRTTTIRQRKLAEVIIENSTLDKPLNGGEMLAKVGYSKGIQKSPSRVIEAEGVQSVLEDYGFTVDNAKKVVSSILLNEKEKSDTRLRASEQVFKVHKAYDEGGNKVVIINVPPQVAQSFSIDANSNGQAIPSDTK